ncbi:hypothetical protein - conserved [Leishmania donovani]|uniref:Hypothetical_protein n=1 Tax=Leishmania donovani TaxID=5661 RepID=A0A6J8F2P8_LEIDO|nr:hypothetical protein - conserved [Leishmania donovani]VDZ41586.1 hypothetical_protein [Leishmania donovani]
MNPLAFDGDGGLPRLQRRSSFGQNGTYAGNAAGHVAYTTAQLPEPLSPLSSCVEVEAMHVMAHRILRPRSDGVRCAARGFVVTVGGDDDTVDVNTSSASSLTTSPQWHRHNPYRTLSTATSTPAHSPRADDSGGRLTLPGSLVGSSGNGSALASQHLNVVFHRHASRGTVSAASGSEASYRPQQASSHPSGHAHYTLLSPKTSQPQEALSRTSSASRASSHYSGGNWRNSSAGLLPDVDVVEGTTSNSGVLLMHDYQFRLNRYGRSRAASSSVTTPQSYATADHFFEETGGFAVDADYGTGSDSRRRSAASHSSPGDVNHRHRSGGVEGGYGGGGTAAAPAPLLLSSLGRCASASFSESSVCDQGPTESMGTSGTARTDTNGGQTGASTAQRSHRPTKPSSVISSIEASHRPPQDWPSAEPSDSDSVPITPFHADPTLAPADQPAAEQHSYAYHPQHQRHQPRLKPSTDAAALPPATGSAAAPSFTVTQLTEMLDAHRARARSGSDGGGGGDGEEGDEVWCPAGSQLSVYDSDMRQHYRIKSEQVAITRGAIKYASLNERYGNRMRFRFQLCNRYLRHRCSSAAKCPYIHSLVVSTATQVHMNENSITTSGVRQMNREELAGGRNTLEYPTIATGMIFAVYPPNQPNSSPQLIPSELILQTEGALHTYHALSGDAAGGATHDTQTAIVRPRHCAHFQFKRMCNLGTSCHFIHSLIPFVQRLVNQPPLPLSVDLSALTSSVAGVVLPAAALDAVGPGGEEVMSGGSGARVANIAAPPQMQGQVIPPVCPQAAEAAREETRLPPPPPPPALLSGPAVAMAPCDRANTSNGGDGNATQATAWRGAKNVSGAALCEEGALLYPTMASVGAAEAMRQPAVIMSPPHRMQQGATVGFFNHRVNTVKQLPVQRQPRQKPLLVGTPLMLVREPQAQPLPPTQHPLLQRWGSAAAVVAPLTTGTAVPLQHPPTAAAVRRGNTR